MRTKQRLRPLLAAAAAFLVSVAVTGCGNREVSDHNKNLKPVDPNAIKSLKPAGQGNPKPGKATTPP